MRALSNYLKLLLFFLLLSFSSCKKESIVENDLSSNPSTSATLAKLNENILVDSTKRKERVTRIKREHEKPYVVIEKPEMLLNEMLLSRSNNSYSKISSNTKVSSIQSSQSCYTIEIDVWALIKYYTRSGKEFGIWPHANRMFAGSSGDPNRILRLNELKSKWGFNYIAAVIGDGQNISAIINAGYPRTTNFMAMITCNQSGRDAVANCCNGLSINDYFWAYYTDEPYSEQGITQYSFKDFRNYVVQLRPSSIFGFGETTRYTANRYTHNPYYWFGMYLINYNPTSVNFVMCSRYDGYYDEIDQRPIWNDLKSLYPNIFKRTWISANKDGSEFNSLLSYCRDYNISPWLYQWQDYEDHSDLMLSQYCYNAYLTNFLSREEKRFIYIWSYVGFDDPCTDYQITSWELADIIETNDIRLLNP